MGRGYQIRFGKTTGFCAADQLPAARPELALLGISHADDAPESLGKKRLYAFQASKRGWELIVEFREDPKGHYHRVLISGQSVIVLEGVFKI